MILQNLSAKNTAAHHRRSSEAPLWEPQISNSLVFRWGEAY